MGTHNSVPMSGKVASSQAVVAFEIAWKANMTRALREFLKPSYPAQKPEQHSAQHSSTLSAPRDLAAPTASSPESNSSMFHTAPEAEEADIREATTFPRRGLFAPACVMHNRFTFAEPKIRGTPFVRAFTLWYNSRPVSPIRPIPSSITWFEDDCAALECNPTCIK
jgi:hypothetical protein